MTTGQALEKMVSGILKEGGQFRNIEIFGGDKVHKKSDTTGTNDLEEVLKMVRGIVNLKRIPSDRISLLRRESYSRITLDNNSRKPICSIYPQKKRTPSRLEIPNGRWIESIEKV